MDHAPPDSKRPRLSTVSLPPPHGTIAHLPPPTVPAHPPTHRPLTTGTFPPYAPRPTDHPPTPSTPSITSGPGPTQHRIDSDRRHHEHESLAPMHDHYRQQPPPSPAQPPYPAYGPGDPLVKREPSDDRRRQNSTGHAPDNPGPAPQPTHLPHHTSTLPPPYTADGQLRPMNAYDAPSALPPTPGGYRPQGFPTPVSHHPAFEQPTGYPTPSQDYQYYSSNPAKKKNTRASQACDQCRQLKAKCDETKPCKTCRDKGSECRYRDPIPKATDKAQADILDGINSMQHVLFGLSESFTHINRRMTTLEQTIAANANNNNNYLAPPDTRYDTRNGTPLPRSVKQDEHRPEDRKLVVAPPYGNGHPEEQYRGNVPPEEPRMIQPDSAPSRMMTEVEIEAEPGPPVPPGEPAIPINHTTGASLLLEWPSIKALTQSHVEKEGIKFVSEYPISQEQSRGVMLVYGRGEDSHSSRHLREMTDHGTFEMADDSSEMSSPSPGADYGQLGGLSPPDSVEYHGGVLTSDGNPDFSEARIWHYVNSFKKNILNMHPIVLPSALDTWVAQFLNMLPTWQRYPHKSARPSVAFAQPPGSSTENTGSKRKRSPDPEGTEGSGTPNSVKTQRPTRSIHSCLVLIVLALGKICLYRERVPDVVHQGADQLQQATPSQQNGIPSSPGHVSPPGPSSGFPSPQDQERGPHTRRSSISGSGGGRAAPHLKKNYEVIPGLEYFALATDILGNQEGGYNSMKNILAHVFAGLYHGQLARPMESFGYIHQASHKLQVMIRPSLDKLRRLKRAGGLIQEPKYNQLALTFWTCLQLESDLIAELQLPPSGLLSYEDDIPHPNMSLVSGFGQPILDSYPGQLYLRTHLNSIHRMFYSPDESAANGKSTDKFKDVYLVADAVSTMDWVAPSFAFSEDDPPAQDILSARLRAKYWGAQVITYRPFIRQILQFNHSVKNHPQSPNMPVSEFRKDIIAPTIHPSAKTSRDISISVIQLAKKGIKALIESTRSFHGLGEEGRPIITNIFGTAHAQWGNLLVLSAAFKDPTLHPHVEEEALRTLFQKTIHFLRQSATATSSLKTDMRILEGLEKDLFPQPDAPQTRSSFSSQTGLPTPNTNPTAPS